MGKTFKIPLLGILATGLLVSLAIIIIFIPRHQVASLKQDVSNLRTENPEAVQDIIIAEKARLDAETAARLALIQGIGLQGIGLIIITGYFSWLNYRSNQKKQSNEDYYKALEHLKDENCFVRINGINALEQYIKIEKQHTQKVINILAAYVRDKSPRIMSSENQESSSVSVPVDIQEAMKVIAFSDRTCQGSETHHIDLTKTDLCRLILPPKANLKGVNFEQSNLRAAVLPEANFQGAILRNTDFTLATLDNADFQKAVFQFPDFERASAKSANFEGTDISASSWQNAKLKGAIFKNAICKGTKFVEADLEDVNFHGAILDWTWFKQAKNISEEKIREQGKSYNQAVGLNGEFISKKI